MEKLRKLLHHLVNGSRSEKRIPDSPRQGLLPFESEEEYQAAHEEAQAEAEQIIEKYEVGRHERKKKRRSEALPADLPRVEVPVDVDDSLRNCPTHGERTQMGPWLSNLRRPTWKFAVFPSSFVRQTRSAA
jgi:hypothetical protein